VVKRPAPFLFLALALGAALPAGAQQPISEPQTFPVERLRLATSRAGLIDVEAADVAPHLAWDAGLWMGYARNPLLVYRQGDNARVGALVADRLGATWWPPSGSSASSRRAWTCR